MRLIFQKTCVSGCDHSYIFAHTKTIRGGIHRSIRDVSPHPPPTCLQVLNIFWSLASNSIEERIENAELLRASCEASDQPMASAGKHQATELDLALPTAAPLLRYCLKRLIRGLSSSRESARQGFSLALSGIIPVLLKQVGKSGHKGASKEGSSSSITKLVRYMDKLFSKKEGQDVIGHLFGLGAIVSCEDGDGSKAGVAFSSGDVEALVEGLVELGRQKSFVKEASAEVLVQLAYKIHADTELLDAFFSCAGLEGLLSTDGQERDATVVALALQLWPWMPKSLVKSCAVLPDGVSPPHVEVMFPVSVQSGKKAGKGDAKGSKTCKGFFEATHLQALRPWLKVTTSTHPHMHGCWKAMLRLLACGTNAIKDFASLQSFWSVLVEEELFDSQSHEKKYLGMTIFEQLLPLVDTKGLKSMMTQKFLRCLGNNANNKQTYLNKASLQAVSALAQKMKDVTADEATDIVSVIRKFGGTQLAHKFASNVPDGKDKSSGMMAEIVELLKKADSGDTSYLFHLSKIPGIVKKHQGDPESCEALLKALIDAHAVVQGQELTSDEGENLPVKILGALLNGVGSLSKAHASIESLVKVEVNLLEHIGNLEDPSGNSGPSETLTELREAVWAKVTTPGSAKTADAGTEAKKLNHFLHLVCLLELYSLINPETSDDEMAADLNNVFKECFGARRKKRGAASASDTADGDVHWADVLVDCVLSVISRNETPYPSAPLRDAGELLFRYFSGDVTRQGLASLFDVIVQSLEGPANQARGPDEDDMDDEDGTDDMEGSSEDEDGDHDGDDGSGSDDDMPDAEASDDEGGDPMDATDEQMFKMDSMLGAYFASHQVKSKKELRDDLINFKLRVMSCLEIFMRLHPESALLLEAPEPLLTSLSAVSRPDGSQVLQERLSGLIKNKLAKCRCTDLAPLGSDPSESVEQQLRKSLYLASRTPVKVVSESAAVAYAYLQRCLHFIEGEGAEGLEAIANESLQAALQDQFTKKKSKLGKSFFPELFKKVPSLVTAAFPTLIELTVSARSPYLQNEALLLLGSAIHMIGDDESRALLADNEDATKAMLESFASSSSKNKNLAKAFKAIEALT